MPFVNRSGVRLYWRVDGEADKPALLLLNAIGVDMALWDRAVPHLMGRFRVVRMDIRGHGASDAPGGEHSLDDLADDALAVLDAADAARAAVCGVSLGAIGVPTLVVAGDRDVSTPFQGHGDRIASAIAGAEVARLDTGHLPCLEAPAAFVGAILDFLVRAGADGAASDARQKLFDAGLAVRRSELGEAWVDRALASRTAFTAEFQAMITRYAWGEVWSRPGLDHRTRRLLVIATTAALGRWEEFRLHVRAGLEQGGFSQDELKEVLLQLAIYAGVPAANTAFAKASAILERQQPAD